MALTLEVSVGFLKIVDCETVRQFGQEAKDILLADTRRIDWLINLAEKKFARSAPGGKRMPGYDNLMAKLKSIKAHYEAGISKGHNAVLLRRAFRNACASASLPLSSRRKTRVEACLYEPE